MKVERYIAQLWYLWDWYKVCLLLALTPTISIWSLVYLRNQLWVWNFFLFYWCRCLKLQITTVTPTPAVTRIPTPTVTPTPTPVTPTPTSTPSPCATEKIQTPLRSGACTYTHRRHRKYSTRLGITSANTRWCLSHRDPFSTTSPV
jgi:hypothetical protein